MTVPGIWENISRNLFILTLNFRQNWHSDNKTCILPIKSIQLSNSILTIVGSGETIFFSSPQPPGKLNPSPSLMLTFGGGSAPEIPMIGAGRRRNDHEDGVAVHRPSSRGGLLGAASPPSKRTIKRDYHEKLFMRYA